MIIFLLVLTLELVGVSVFGWIAAQGLFGWKQQHWIGTFIAFIASVGLSLVIPRQIPSMVGEVTGSYLLRLSVDRAELLTRRPFTSIVRSIGLSPPAYVGVLRFLPTMTLIMIQAEERLCFGAALDSNEQIRIQGLIREGLSHMQPLET